eukprot:evm.model.scf_105.2 EVM.evm.TU.scf_105.2   scf_105:47348-49142(+)
MHKPSTTGRWCLGGPSLAGPKVAMGAAKPVACFTPRGVDLAVFHKCARKTACCVQKSHNEGMQTFQSVPVGPPPLNPTEKCQECGNWAGGWMWSLYVVTFTGIAAVSSLAVAFIVSVSPILKASAAKSSQASFTSMQHGCSIAASFDGDSQQLVFLFLSHHLLQIVIHCFLENAGRPLWQPLVFGLLPEAH